VNDALERFARDFPAGSVLFEEGQPGDYMYVVQTGEVEIRRQVGETERVLAILPPGEFFGEMAILNGRPRSATAVCKTKARLLVIEGKTFEAMMRARPEIALRIIKALATRLDLLRARILASVAARADRTRDVIRGASDYLDVQRAAGAMEAEVRRARSLLSGSMSATVSFAPAPWSSRHR